MKRILITGKNSYIGTSFEAWMKQYGDSYAVDTIETRNDTWMDKDFSIYDVVFHVAGIAHADVGNVSEEQKALYYRVNRDLTIEIAKKSKRAGIKQFIFMSSIIVYGDSAPIGKRKVITAHTEPNPSSFYGDSKLQAEKGLVSLNDENFKVVIIRPPMIYGKGCKGNYQILVKLACRIPVFPKIKNERSVLYIDNLCEFVRLLVDKHSEGIFFPQNKELVATIDMVHAIATFNNNKLYVTSLFNWLIRMAASSQLKVGRIINKAFGSLVYEPELTKNDGIYPEYMTVDFNESIRRTQQADKTILMIVNHDLVIYNFRKELVQRLIGEGYKVVILSPYGERIDLLKKMSCQYIETRLERHGRNPLADAKLFLLYVNAIKRNKPCVVLTYTIKPNIYGSLACRLLKVPYIVNITGLGGAIEKGGFLQKLIIGLYRLALLHVSTVFFQNTDNQRFFQTHNFETKNHKLLPGSGVNLNQFHLLPYPPGEKLEDGSKTIEFIFISRIMKDKGIEEYLQAAAYITSRYHQAKFHILGFCEEDYQERLNCLQGRGIINYHGMQRDILPFLEKSHCTIHPSYHEGMSNVCLESAACGRPIIATDISGCRETVEHGITGYLIEAGNAGALIDTIETFISLSDEERRMMGIRGMEKIQREFDRNIVVEAYMDEITKINNRNAANEV